MKLIYRHVYSGPSLYADEPVIVADLLALPSEIEGWPEACARLQAEFSEWDLLSKLPDQFTGVAAVAHCAVKWALAALNESRGYLHAAGVASDEGDERQDGEDCARLFIAYHHVPLAKKTLELALRLLGQAVKGRMISRSAMDSELDRLWAYCHKHHPDYQASILMQGARDRGIPYLPLIHGERFWQFGWGCRAEVFYESSSNAEGMLGQRWAGDKSTAKAVFAALGAPVAASVVVTHPEHVPEAVKAVGLPCVTKPIRGSGGKGVSAGLRSLHEVYQGFELARQLADGPVLLESFVPGDDHRVMIAHGRVVAVICRRPPTVFGDGQRTVQQLVDALNAQRGTVSLSRRRYLRPVRLDSSALICLKGQGLDLDAVPEAGCEVRLRSNANLSSGGTCEDVTDRVHPDIVAMAQSLAISMGLKTAGFDYMTTDITQSWRNARGAFLEVNTTPGLDAMVAAGWSEQAVATRVLGEQLGRIPVSVWIVPDEVLPRWRQQLQAVHREPGQGLWCDGQAWLGDVPLAHNLNATDSLAVSTLLHHRGLEELTVVWGKAQLLMRGFPVDRAHTLHVCVSDLSHVWRSRLQALAETVIWSDAASSTVPPMLR